MNILTNYRKDQEAAALRGIAAPINRDLAPMDPNKDICPHNIYIYSFIPCAAYQDAAGTTLSKIDTK